MKILDTFIFFNEVELLKIRLELLYPYVDRFVICEANTTFSGQPKGYNFLDHEKEFAPWQDKINFLRYEPDISGLDFTRPHTFDGDSAPWRIEQGQRNHLRTCLEWADEDDIVIVSDVDEIWSPEVAGWLDNNHAFMPAGRLGMQFHYFYMNCRGVGPANSSWKHPFFAKAGLLRSLQHSFDDIRNRGDLPTADNAGWHFSYLGGAESVIRKIESFSHQELNTEEVKKFDRISRCINLGLDPFDRSDHHWAFFPVESYPDPLSALMRRNPSLVKATLL